MHGYQTPVYDAIRRYTDTGPLPFHMPGHKLGSGIPAGFLKKIEMLDVTEIPGTDNLHDPAGPIREAQELAALAFGADKTFFLVNGSTGGIHAMIAALCQPGGRLIVTRDCHKSVFGGMLFAGAEPVFLLPEYNSGFGIMGAVTPKAVAAALDANPDAAGVLLTRPNYYGICCDIAEIAEIVHSHGKLLAVDEAHGAHLCFDDTLPASAMAAGADICVQSAHKTLPAFTQGAYLHVKGGRIDVERVEFMLDILQTTSPSYVIMAYLDIARSIMQQDGKRLLGKLLSDIRFFKQEAEGIGGLKFLMEGKSDQGQLDGTRIVANLEDRGLTGYEVHRLLREDFGIELEMSDYSNIVAIATVADGTEELKSFFEAVSLINTAYGRDKTIPRPRWGAFELPESRLPYREALRAVQEWIPLKQAVGRIGSGMVAPYPPGIPLIFPGEVITDGVADYLLETLECGGAVTGVDKDRRIRVCGRHQSR